MIIRVAAWLLFSSSMIATAESQFIRLDCFADGGSRAMNRVFSGFLAVPEGGIVTRENGSLAVSGRTIQLTPASRAERTDCRFFHSVPKRVWNFYEQEWQTVYEKVGRKWNVYEASAAPRRVILTCAPGSVLEIFDTTKDWLNEYYSYSSHGIRGELAGSVSSEECVESKF